MRIGLDYLSDVSDVSSGVITYLSGFLKALSVIDQSDNQYYFFVNSGNVESFKTFNTPNFHLVQKSRE